MNYFTLKKGVQNIPTNFYLETVERYFQHKKAPNILIILEIFKSTKLIILCVGWNFCYLANKTHRKKEFVQTLKFHVCLAIFCSVENADHIVDFFLLNWKKFQQISVLIKIKL
jgi:hypothetical protein